MNRLWWFFIELGSKALIRMYLAATTALLALSSSAAATTVFPQKFTCPIGGEKFEAYVIGSSSSWGQRPDGKEYGTTPIWPVTECPDNGLPLFEQKFTKQELALLEAAVLSEEFQRMRQSETAHYRIWWLQGRLGRNAYQRASSLLKASWETDYDPARKARYQTEFVDSVKDLMRDDIKAEGWFWYSLRAANALRELGKLQESAALLDAIDRSEFVPKEKDQSEGARYLIDGLRTLIGEANVASEPTNLIPATTAIFECEKRAKNLSPSEIRACAGNQVQNALAEFELEDDDGTTLKGRDAVLWSIAHRGDY